MRVAVIGAGIVGVTTAYELGAEGHEVTVYERRGSVAEENSFANAGVIAPGYVSPWAAPGMPSKVLQLLLQQHSPVRLARPWVDLPWRWIWQWWRSCSAVSFQVNRQRMHRLARYSQQRLHTLCHELRLEHEQTQGYMVLLRTPQDLALARNGLKQLAELGVSFQLISGERARAVEPRLNPQMPLHAAVHLPDAEVGNCRQFAHLLRNEAQRLGVAFRFQRQVHSLTPGAHPIVRYQTADASGDAGEQVVDAVIVCAAMGAPGILEPLGCRLPLTAVHGHSITAPMRRIDGYADIGPKASVMDEKYKVAICRLGQRVRVAGGAELGGRLDRTNTAALATLYKVLDDWFPGCAQLAKVQQWKGARPMLPDGPPVLGASGVDGVWLNLGHGSSGWALSCGSARVLADLLAGRAPEIDIEGLDLGRLRR